MEWRMRASSHGGFVAEFGCQHNGGAAIPGIVGVTLPAFIVYESRHFDTERKARAFIQKQAK